MEEEVKYPATGRYSVYNIPKWRENSKTGFTKITGKEGENLSLHLGKSLVYYERNQERCVRSSIG